MRERAEDLVAVSTRSPGLRLGANENGVPVAWAEAHGAAGLAVFAAADRFAALGAEPVRLGDLGSVSTALAGSRSGTGGIATRFAPSGPRPAGPRLRLRPVPVLPDRSEGGRARRS